MASPLRHIPMTPLDELRACLGNHLEGDAAAQVRLHHLLNQLRQQALPDLGGRLVRTTTPAGLKRLIMGLTAKFDWPEWVPWLFQALQHEQDLGVFDEGCAALGRLEIRSAREALLKLADLRTDPDRQLILRRELGAQETQPLSFYLGRLLEGEGNARLAHQGARGLAALARPEDLPALLEAMAGADPLAFRMLVRALTEAPGHLSGPPLLAWFTDTLLTLEDLELLDDLSHRVHTGARTAARAELAEALSSRMMATHGEAVQALQKALAAGEAGNPIPPLDALRAQAKGPYETFLTEALTILVEGKVARFAAMVTEAQDTLARQRNVLGTTLAQVCEGLVRLVAAGQFPADRVT
ncbi:MAG TPA: hypothetical protein VK150_08510, partial [Geothrix sp.]|nr:hypothetical protein [Geothrix sp.]